IVRGTRLCRHFVPWDIKHAARAILRDACLYIREHRAYIVCITLRYYAGRRWLVFSKDGPVRIINLKDTSGRVMYAAGTKCRIRTHQVEESYLATAKNNRKTAL